jgi:uncharacterized protein (TIGR02452 family)
MSINENTSLIPTVYDELVLSSLPLPSTGPFHLVVRVIPQDCLVVCEELANHSLNLPIGLLNFASGTNPGGMIRANATKAQEESICSRSTLLQSLTNPNATKFYETNRSLKGSQKKLMSQSIIFSPHVQIHLNHQTNFSVHVISAPAVHAYGYRIHRQTERAKEEDIENEIATTMYQRIMNIFKVAANERIQSLVLGAFGCGVFGNSPIDVANVFQSILTQITTNGLSWLKEICFAIQDNRKETFLPFERLKSKDENEEKSNETNTTTTVFQPTT